MTSHKKLTAVVVEDDATTRRLIGSLVRKWDFNVVECPDGESAWLEIEKISGPLLAVVDWMMPGISGVDLCRRIRALGKVRAGYIYTIMLTGKGEHSDMVEAIERGIDAYLKKPLDKEELRVAVNAGRRILSSAVMQHELALELEIKSHVLEALYQDLDLKVQERTKELDASMRRAEAASKLKSEFLANMSHEIRTPLNGIISYTDLLIDSELTDEQINDVRIIKSSAHALKQIINDILDLSKVEAGQLSIDHSAFHLSNLLSETSDIVELMAMERQVELVIARDPCVPDELIGDNIRIQQILMNLLGNAVKFCHSGGGVLVWVDGAASEGGFTLRISVADSGIGIPEDRQKSVFEAFQQADGSTTRKYGGTGLGLTICKKLVHLMDGQLWLESMPGVGSAFHFTVPCGTVSTRATVLHIPTADSSVQALWEEIAPLTLLLADDHVVNRNALVRILESKGHTVLTAGTGEEVLQVLRIEPVDIVLMDIQMPVMGGDEATKLIRESSSIWSQVPIIALTANAFESERTRLLELGMNAFVPKPIGQRELALALQELSKQCSESEEHPYGNSE
jgi:signal transduction histidine kinase